MSEITFDGDMHLITVRDRAGHIVGTWPANNRTILAADTEFIPDGVYRFYDRREAHHHSEHEDSLAGRYGTNGILRLYIDGHLSGLGLHAGRQGVRDRSRRHGAGAYHVTEGCIRTTEAAMSAIAQLIRNDPLEHLIVRNNHNQR